MKKIVVFVVGLFAICIVGILGTFFYWKWTILPKESMIPIFCYHKISDDSDAMSISQKRFDTQLDGLKKDGYYTITLDELGKAWKEGRKLGPGAIVTTFDDGYQNNLSQAQPVLEKYQYSATLFLIVNRQIQWDFLDWDEVRNLVKKGWAIGSHSWSHVDLSVRPDYHAQVEIGNSKKEIERRTNSPVAWFAYPYGAWNQRTAEWLEYYGYEGAVTTRVGLASPKDGLYSLDRIPVIPSKIPARIDIQLRIWRAEWTEFLRWLF